MQTELVVHSPSAAVRVALPSLPLGETSLRRGSDALLFRQIKGRQRTLLASLDSQLPSGQNSPWAKVAYFGGHVLIPSGPTTLICVKVLRVLSTIIDE